MPDKQSPATPLTPHPRLEQLVQAIRGLRGQWAAWEGVFYRAVSPRYATTNDALSGIGGRMAGGRWSPPGRFKAVYASMTPETAMAESLQLCRHYGIPVHQAMPKTFFAAQFSCSRTLDFRSQQVVGAIGTTPAELRQHDWRTPQKRGREAFTQAVGVASFTAGLAAILVPSAADPEGSNVVVFLENLGAGDRLIALSLE